MIFNIGNSILNILFSLLQKRKEKQEMQEREAAAKQAEESGALTTGQVEIEA